MVKGRLYRAGIIGAALLAWLWLSIPSASAHAVPVLSEPQPNAILETAPTELSIRFNEPVVPELSRIEVLSQAGQTLAVGDGIATDAENRTLAVSLPAMANGTYLVSWRALSAVDGHTTSGTFSFGVGVASLLVGSQATTVIAQQSFLSAAARWLTLTGTALLLGLVTFRLFILNPVLHGIDLEPEEEQLDLDHARSSLKIGGVGAMVIVAGLFLAFVDQVNAYNLFQSGNIETWLLTRYGSMWLTRLLLTAAFAFLLANLFLAAREGRRELPSREWWAGFLLGLGLALTTSLVSHSAALSADTTKAVVVDFIHIVAASLWVGGLIYLALALGQARRLPDDSRMWFHLSLLLNFSALAAIAIGSLITSGGYLAWQHVGSWTTLVSTAYGLTLLAKIALALPAFGMAAINLLIIKPRLNAVYEDAETPHSIRLMRRFRALVGLEAAFALLILLAAGILTDLQRGKDAPLLSDAPGKTVVAGSADDLEVNLSIEPALVGQNSFDVHLVDSHGNPATDATKVSLRYTFLGQSIGADEGEAVPADDGHYVLEGSYISLIGTWQVEVAIRRPGAFDTFVPFRLEAGLGGNIRPLEGGARPLERFAKLMVLAGGGATGIFMVLFAIGWGFLAIRAAKNEWQLLPLLLISLLLFWVGSSQLLDFFGQEFTPARFITNPVLPDAASVAIGQALYDGSCASCHGQEGRGDGPNAALLPSPPADFGSGHTAIHPDGDLYFWIREGIADTQMPAFGEQFTKEEVWHLVNYVRRLSAQASQPVR
jgi:copper transport protein